MGPFIALLAAIFACGIAQVVAIVKLYGLRRRHGSARNLQAQPAVKKWMRWCRGPWFVAIVLAATTAATQQPNGIYFAMAMGVGSTTLLGIASFLSDNSAGHGDGDSG